MDAEPPGSNNVTLSGNIIRNFQQKINQYNSQARQQPKKSNVWFQIRKCNNSFTGRIKELEDIHNKLQQNKQIVIHGLGGVGKTELTRKYVLDQRKLGYYVSGIWINAENHDSIKDSFIHLAKQIGIEIDEKYKSVQQIASEIYVYLEKKNCIFIFDNALNRRDLNNYLPDINNDQNFYTIITSQNREWGDLAFIALSVLSEEESIQLFTQILKEHCDVNKEYKNILKLAQVLQYLPLAIQIAGAYIIDKMQYDIGIHYTIEQYLEEIEKNKDIIMKEQYSFMEYNNSFNTTVYTTLQLSIARITSDQNSGQIASDILNLSALLAPDNIPKELFLPHFDENQLNTSLRAIAKYSVITIKNDIFDMHRIVQLFLYSNMKSTNSLLYSVISKALRLVIQDTLVDTAHNQSVLQIATERFDFVINFYKNCTDYQKINFLSSLSLHGKLTVMEYLSKSIERSFLFITYQRIKTHPAILIAAVHRGYVDIIKFYVKNGGRVIFKNEYDIPLIIIAACYGHLQVVQYLVELGANVDDKTKDDHTTPLHNAAKNGHAEVVEYLVSKVTEIDAVTKTKRSALHFAVTGGNLDIVRCLVDQGADVNIKDELGKTPLYLACLNGHTEIVQYLVENGANINDDNKELHSIPLYAAVMSGYIKIVKYLVSEGAKINSTTKEKHSALHWAVNGGDLEIVKYLVSQKADINFKDDLGMNPLHLACLRGHIEILQYLFKTGANFNDDDNMLHLTPLYIAAVSGHIKIVEYLVANVTEIDKMNEAKKLALYCIVTNGYLDIVKSLVDHGVDINIKDQYNYTPLFWACQDGQIEIVQYLVENGANINDDSDEIHMTPLHTAALNGHIKIVKHLVSKGAKINTLLKNKQSVLHHAAYGGHVEIVKYLMDQNADINILDDRGCSPLVWACKEGHTDVVQYLIEAGGNVNEDNNVLHVTPLLAAAANGHSKTVEWLITNGAKLDALTNTNYSPLFIATRQGHLDVVQYLINRLDINIKEILYLTFHIAVLKSHLPIIKTLVTRDKTLVNNNILELNISPLMLSCRNITIAKYLLSQGAYCNVIDIFGNTALFYAAGFNVEVVKFLIENGAVVDEPNMIGLTPLSIAFISNNSQTVKYLIEKGANCYIKLFNNFSLNITATLTISNIFEHLSRCTSSSKLQNINKDFLKEIIECFGIQHYDEIASNDTDLKEYINYCLKNIFEIVERNITHILNDFFTNIDLTITCVLNREYLNDRLFLFKNEMFKFIQELSITLIVCIGFHNMSNAQKREFLAGIFDTKRIILEGNVFAGLRRYIMTVHQIVNS